MEETLSNSRFISCHRNQINPQPLPESTLTFAYGNAKYGKSFNLKIMALFFKNRQDGRRNEGQ